MIWLKSQIIIQTHWYLLHWICHRKDSKYVNIHSENPLYLIVDNVDGFIEEKEGNKYLNPAFTDNNSEVLKKSHIKKVDNRPSEYGKDYMKIKFNSSDDFFRRISYEL